MEHMDHYMHQHMPVSKRIQMGTKQKQTSHSGVMQTGVEALRIVALALPLCIGLAACERAVEPPAAAVEPAVAAVSPTAPVQTLLAASTTETKPPADSAALASVYGDNNKNASEYALPDGRYVGFWHGYAYRNGGKERYTAFVHAAPPNETGIARPEDQVELAQISYTLGDGGWQPDQPQTDVGRFGGMGQAPNFDGDRIVLTYDVSPERALLAVPSAVAATGGVQINAYETFTLDSRGVWRHVGTIQSGADYSASCRNGPATPDTECVRNVGRMRFDPAADGAMPIITMNFSGTGRDEDGAIRQLGPDDTRTYRYDEATASYSEVQAQ